MRPWRKPGHTARYCPFIGLTDTSSVIPLCCVAPFVTRVRCKLFNVACKRAAARALPIMDLIKLLQLAAPTSIYQVRLLHFVTIGGR